MANPITRREVLQWAAGSAAVAALPGVTRAAAGSEERPNVVFIVADDLGYGELGCFGQKKIRTPNLDRLASQGMRLTQHYSGNAVCAPSRCVLMTGLHPGHAFIRDNKATPPEGQYPIPADTVTMAKLFQQQGYVTGAMGKWGLGGPGSTGEPLKQGIDRFFGYNCQGHAHTYYPTYLWDNDKHVTLDNPDIKVPQKLPEGADPKNPESYRAFEGKQYAPDVYNEQARKFVRDNKDRPFFLFLPTIVPHVSLQVPEDSLKEYEGMWPDEPYVGGRGYLPHRAPRAAYAAMITRMDREIGRLMDLLDELKLTEKTIVVFSSDNGPLYDDFAGTDCDFFESAGPFRGRKGSLYEGGFRVPGIIRYPGKVAAGSTCDRVTGFEDWMPTLMEMIGGPQATPKGIDGISFAPTVCGKKQEERPFLYREFPAYGGQQCLRMGNWKAVRQNLMKKTGRGEIELYDLAADPAESKDVAAANPQVVERMRRIMKEQHTPSKVFAFAALDNQ